MEATKLAALHWGKRADRSARSPSVLMHYFTLTSIAFDLAIGVVGRCTFSTPSWNSAVTFVLSASSGSVKLRRKVPKDRSMRWNFFLRSSFSLLRSPETLRMPSSTFTLTSSFFISGSSALSRYPRSSSLMSTSGDQSATARLSISPLLILFGKPPKKKGLKRFCVACSICLSGFHVITLFNVFILFTFLDRVKAILVHCAHRLLSESTRILCTLRNGAGGKQTTATSIRLRSIPEPHALSRVTRCKTTKMPLRESGSRHSRQNNSGHDATDATEAQPQRQVMQCDTQCCSDACADRDR